MPKVLILTGDAAESLEVMYPYQRLLEEGYQVDIAAPSAKKLQFVVHDFVDGYDTYTAKPGYTWPADLAFADVNPADYVAPVMPGGRAPEYIRNDPDVQRIVWHCIAGTSRSPSSATRRRCSPRPAPCRAAGPPPTRRWPPAWPRRAPSSWTGPRSSTGKWSRPGP